jgi:hypothetical protein
MRGNRCLFTLLICILSLNIAGASYAQTIRPSYDPISLDNLLPITADDLDYLIKLGEIRFYNVAGRPVWVDSFTTGADSGQAAVLAGSTIALVDLIKGVETNHIDMRVYSGNLVYSPNNTFLALTSGSMTLFDLRLLDTGDASEYTYFPPWRPRNYGISIVGWDEREQKLLAATNEVISVWDMETLKEIDRLVNVCQNRPQMHANGTSYFCIADNQLIRYDVETHEVIEAFALEIEPAPYLMSISANGSYALVTSWDDYSALQLDTGEAYMTFAAPENRVHSGIVINDNSPYLYVNMIINNDGTVAVTQDFEETEIEVRNLRAEGDFFSLLFEDRITDFQFNADSTLLLVSDRSGRLSLYGIPKCRATAARDVNLRTGPGTTYPIGDTLRAGSQADVTGQFHDAENHTWWRLASELWVRDDVTEISGAVCAEMPVVVGR